MKYRKKPVEIEAVQLTWANWVEVCDFVQLPWGPEGVHGCYSDKGVESDSGEKIGLIIPTLEGNMLANENDYIIKGVHGEFYPCKPDIFEETYEPSGRSVDGKLLAEKLAVPIKHEIDKQSRREQRRKGFL
ncbi:hypothetical protein [uncultured Lacticaseibacillus sp.]|uniref:hypothetical protein n=1 Tax=uncultured Lacticaseibacillus sp. TaxID=2775882 RepID=UPI0025870353|nr:hypothetical protein [uncultured Lacticaseibacillus sp.]